MTILFLWAVVGFTHHGSPSYDAPTYDWRPLGQFESMQACKKAMTTLGIDPKYGRCVSASTGESK